MRSMFYGCSALTYVPDMDTSQVTSMRGMFYDCSSLTYVPDMDTSQVTDMGQMFRSCASLTYVPDMDTSQVTDVYAMFYNCSALTDGNVRLIGRHPNVNTDFMTSGSGLTREPFYKADGTPDDGIEVHEVTLTNVTGRGDVHPLLTVTVPAGETWSVRIQGTVTQAPSGSTYQPFFRIGVTDSGVYGPGAAVDFSGTATATNSTIAMVTNDRSVSSFVGTVTIEKAAPPSGGRYAWAGSTGRVPESGNLPAGLTPLITHTVTAPGTTTASVTVTFDYEWPDVEATIELTKNGVVIGTRVPDLKPTQSLTVTDFAVAAGDIIELRINSDTDYGAWYPVLSSSLTLA